LAEIVSDRTLRLSFSEKNLNSFWMELLSSHPTISLKAKYFASVFHNIPFRAGIFFSDEYQKQKKGMPFDSGRRTESLLI